MATKKQLERIKKDFIIYTEKPIDIPGGQHCGVVIYPTVVEHPGLDIKISIGYYRSNHKNKALALLLAELTLEELIN